jgi:exo-1,4-beta-D-glucosaminidase
VTIRLHNPSQHIAFFEKAAISVAPNGDETLSIEYDDIYIIVSPGETTEIHAMLPQGAKAGRVKLEGYNTSVTPAQIQ